MIRHRTTAAAVFTGVTFLLGSALLTAGPAHAHGAPTNPLSRVAACGLASEGRTGTPACRAAVAAQGGLALGSWDNLRVAGVGGRDRQTIPDGTLCSGGLDAYRGLDLARGDWPTTTLRGGAGFTLTYRSSIPHEGTFRVYLTRPGYSSNAPLTWGDLDPAPFLTATDPPLENGAYRISGRLPGGRTGRHVMYTVWQNSSTPDTYYSCSDLVLTGGSTGDTGAAAPTKRAPVRKPASTPPTPAAPSASRPGRRTLSPTPPPSSAVPSDAPAAAAAPSSPGPVNASPVADSQFPVSPVAAVTAAGTLAVAAAGMFLALKRRTATAGRTSRRHRRP